jgi:hypothetical protein
VRGQQPKGVDQHVPLAAVAPLCDVLAVRPPFRDLAAQLSRIAIAFSDALYFEFRGLR